MLLKWEKPWIIFFMLAHDIKNPVNQIKKLIILAKTAGSASETDKILELALKSSNQNIVIFTVHEAKNSIIVKVADNGRGIGKDRAEKVFDKAFQVNNDDQGNGLGLYLVKKSLNELGAYIDVESREGEGTTFTIELPFQGREIRSMTSA